MPSRFEYERAIRGSDLPPLSRLLALTLATWADVKTGVIPERLTPSLTTLERATGMDRSTVRRHLNKIEGGGWVVRRRPEPSAARSKKARTRYRITVPPGIEVPDSEGYGLGAENPITRGTQPLDGDRLGAHSPQPRGTQPLELGAENPITRGTVPPKSSYGPERSVEYQQASQSAEPAARIGGRPRIPAASQPLVDAITAAGMAVGWDLQPPEWFLIEALIRRCGVGALVTSARGSWQGARTQPRSARYFLPAWRALPDAVAAPEPGQPQLPAAVGDVLPMPHRPSTTDQRVQQALDLGRRLQAQADAAQENS